MAATLSVNDSSTWRNAKGVYVNDTGTWRTVKTVSVNDAGTWRQVYQNVVISLPAGNIGISRANGSPALFQLSSDGNLYRDSTGTVVTYPWTWITDAAQANQYNCLASITSGTFTSGTANTQVACSSSPIWTVAAGAGLAKTCNFTFSIIRISDSVTVASCSGQLQVDRT